MQEYRPVLTEINHIINMGDSLSDKIRFKERELLYGIIPNNFIVDMSKSPHGRFSNGYNWVDYTTAMKVSKFLGEDIEKKLNMRADDISDGIEDDDPNIRPKVQAENSLDNNVDAEGERYSRMYCEGGLTSHNYGKEWIANLKLMLARKIVVTLESMRQQLLEDDKKLGISNAEKKSTLIIEWSGGNDLITVCIEPTREEADSAVAARMENIEQLYANGYRNFVLANLPDLATTPRFQALTEKDRANATDVCNYFNAELAKRCLALQQKYPDAAIHIFDANSAFNEIYKNPAAHGFDEDKKHQPYLTSKDYVMNKNHTSPAKKYMFWDDIHPTAHMHAILGVKFSKFIDTLYNMRPPAPTPQTDPKFMVKKFLSEYHKKLSAERKSLWSGWGLTTTPKLPHVTIESEQDYPRVLADILYHGVNENGTRTLTILQNLGWVNKNKEINYENPALLQAKEWYDLKTTAPRVNV